MAVGRLTQLVLECADAEELATFWQTVLELPPAIGTPGWLTLEWPDVARLSFHRVENYVAPRWPGERGSQQMHFDLLVDGLANACEAIELAGGTPLSDVLNPGPREWRIYADPAGHPFCLVAHPT